MVLLLRASGAGETAPPTRAQSTVWPTGGDATKTLGGCCTRVGGVHRGGQIATRKRSAPREA
jgi:hypothetical protein